MFAIRMVLSVAMIVVGGIIFARMLPYPIAQSFTGLVLGAAMIALGVIRMRQLLRVGQSR